MDTKNKGFGKKLVMGLLIVLGLFSVFLIAACENSIECKDAAGNTRTWSTANCPAYKCKGTNLICCEGAICNDVCYNDVSKLQSTEGCILPGQTTQQCPANQVWDDYAVQCKNISEVSGLETACPVEQYNQCFLDCLHKEFRECDKATCQCGDYFCNTKYDCPAGQCNNWQCVTASDGKSRCVC